MKLQVRSSGGELTVQSQKELLQLYNRRIVADDDEVLRGDRWVRVRDLPWIHGMREDRRADGKRLIWITVAMMLVGLLAVFWLQGHAGTVVRKTGVAPTPAAPR